MTCDVVYSSYIYEKLFEYTLLNVDIIWVGLKSG